MGKENEVKTNKAACAEVTQSLFLICLSICGKANNNNKI